MKNYKNFNKICAQGCPSKRRPHYVDKSVRYYMDSLAARTPAPGGGSVAALLGALGCGLLSMVANFTLAKKGFNGYKERAKKAVRESERLRVKLAELIDKDIEAYERLSKVLKKHKDNPAKLEAAFKKAVTPPAKVCCYVNRAAGIALELGYIGNKSIISDVSVAMYALDAAFESALVNINANLKYIRDRRYVTEKSQQYIILQRDMKKLKTEVLSKAKERMFG